MNEIFYVKSGKLSDYDVIVCGGGFAGVAAAVSSAKNGARTLLCENGGELGGDITKGLVIQLLDPCGKGGMLRDIYDWLNDGGHTSARKGLRYNASGEKLPGTVVDMEYTKYYLEKLCRDAGVEVIYHTLAADVQVEEDSIKSILLSTESGCFTARARNYIDATGNGLIAKLAGCKYECGHPQTGEPQPAGSALFITGLPVDFEGSRNNNEKEQLKAELEQKGIRVSAEGVTFIQSTIDGVWMLAFNSQFGVMPDDPLALSRAQSEARIECLEVFDAIKSIEKYKDIQLLQTSSHIGVREGRRIIGKYKLTFDDIVNGRRFDDSVCLVKFPIDVHKISPNDDRVHSCGKKVHPYNIPFRALIPEDCKNLLLAGRCISGDFYAHSSYRVIGNVVPTGEASGFAAAVSSLNGSDASGFDGLRVSAYMRSLGYEL